MLRREILYSTALSSVWNAFRDEKMEIKFHDDSLSKRVNGLDERKQNQYAMRYMCSRAMISDLHGWCRVPEDFPSRSREDELLTIIGRNNTVSGMIYNSM